ncbi:S8 family serine peptidase [Roseateles sp. DAIF2]|uniref:S8 family peptidase n=1 Tax=Roseateles sp. DAIF2 TaxID=2714952 RepID=UPI0018A2DF65|nr:S8 family serine peptidase [Roseateles sp. DAIF2]QPF73325.1 S8 family serine peptidase [Roseateles sp. DAIF2]
MVSHSLLRSAALIGAAIATLSAAHAQQGLAPRAATVEPLASPVTGTALSQLGRQTGTVQVVVRLADQPLALAVGANAKRTGGSMTLAQRQAYVSALKSKQDAVMGQIKTLGGTELTRLSKSYNALVIAADASKLPQIARIAGVSALRPVVDLQTSLRNSVPYVGARALQDLGLTGQGVKIAVLDSGIDYTHRNLGGPGNPAAFASAAAAADGTAPAGLYPSAKVIGGYDFVGGSWPNGPLAPDANPIDAGTGAGHGTHVADIAAGASLDGLHKGMAPDAKLYAVKVCSSVTTSCSGVAILQGLEWAMDPRGDLSFADAADVVNLSLGANYGQRENPATEAVSNLARFGIVVVASAGNSGDKPFVVGSPSNAAEAISVAQTAMPTDTAIPLLITAPAAIAGSYANTAQLPWAPLGAGFSGTVRLGGLACTPAETPDLTGAVALVDRGNCNISEKVSNASAKGAIGVLIANNVAGDAPSFSFGTGTPPFNPSLVITQATGNLIKARPDGTVAVSVSAANALSLAGSMATTSSRGPSFNFAALKPEIGAPGASISALTGTATGEEAFGGTSGAAPVVSGAAALLLQKFPAATVSEIKSRLMNSATTTVYTNPATQPGVLAPITRIGGGEVRVDRAASITTGLWDASNPFSVGLSFGAVKAAGNSTLSKKVAVRNYGASPRTYTITRGFRYANDEANGAVTLSAPASITVPANGSSSFTLTLSLDASKLPAWNLGSAANQGNGVLLSAMEYDGYITVSDGTDGATLPWHILPRKSANNLAAPSLALGGASGGNLPLSNLNAAVPGPVEVFALTGTSPQSSTSAPPYGGNQILADIKAVGVRQVNLGGPLGLQFAIASYGERAHPAYPAEYSVYVDSNNDGTPDYAVYNSENTGFGASGQTVVTVRNLATNATVVRFYADADLMSSNIVYTVQASDIGITSASQQFSFSVYAFDNYFTGDLTDAVVNMKHTLSAPRFTSPLGDSLTVPMGYNDVLPVGSNPAGATASPSQKGLLLLHRTARTARESDVVTITP